MKKNINLGTDQLFFYIRGNIPLTKVVVVSQMPMREYPTLWDIPPKTF